MREYLTRPSANTGRNVPAPQVPAGVQDLMLQMGAAQLLANSASEPAMPAPAAPADTGAATPGAWDATVAKPEFQQVRAHVPIRNADPLTVLLELSPTARKQLRILAEAASAASVASTKIHDTRMRLNLEISRVKSEEHQILLELSPYTARHRADDRYETRLGELDQQLEVCRRKIAALQMQAAELAEREGESQAWRPSVLPLLDSLIRRLGLAHWSELFPDIPTGGHNVAASTTIVVGA